jgi:electron transfer flavoprotein beta subunit
VTKEYPESIRAELELDLPAVLGIQAAEKPPRYIPVAKLRAAMKTQRIETAAIPEATESALPHVETLEMKKLEPAGQAAMLASEPDRAASELCAVLSSRGLL